MDTCTSRAVASVVCCAMMGLLGNSAPATAQSTPLPAPQAISTFTPPATVPGAGGLLKATVNDFKHLPSTDTAKILAIGAASALLVRQTADNSTSRFLSQSPTADTVLESGATIGGARLQLAGALATYGVGRLTGSSKVTTVGGDLLRAQIVAQVLTAGIKFAAQRTRPDGTRYSFPSGHTSVTFATATVLQRDLGPKWGIPAYAVATYVAASRIQDRRHFLSDVAFGATIGFISGRTVTVGRGRTRFAVAPAAIPGGAGVSFNLLNTRWGLTPPRP